VISLAQTGFSWAVRVAAVEALARAEGPAITPALAQCALHDPFAAVRLAAVRALVQRAPRAPEARAALDTVRAADADRSVRDAAVVAREGHAP
jgi:HEAT repeat protein